MFRCTYQFPTYPSYVITYSVDYVKYFDVAVKIDTKTICGQIRSIRQRAQNMVTILDLIVNMIVIAYMTVPTTSFISQEKHATLIIVISKGVENTLIVRVENQSNDTAFLYAMK